MALSAEICSSALVALGDKPIHSLEEQQDRAITCAAVYDTVRDALLRAHPWNCCTRRVILSPLAEEPAFDFKYQFSRPADWLRTIQVGHQHCPIPYRSEGRRILAHVDALPLVYIWRNEDESSWDSLLVELMELAIKARIAYAITKSSTEREVALNEYQQRLKQAKAIDGQDDPPEEFAQETDLLEARRGWRGLR
ncbi:hypothetical protein [Pigmentiphaga sp. CHJ604]|uniref:hypothetical protein n=1 Tax=Pigmentiphaga sp. CHJ604 TaxID=3081984 RepID=UPI0030D31994